MADDQLERFRDGYRRDYEHALREISAGRKRSHWMWFIFPQVAGLGRSPTAVHYAIRDRSEAEAFLCDPDLGPRYRMLVDAVWHQVIGAGLTLQTLLGSPDDQKLVSSLTLCAIVGGNLGEGWTATVAQCEELLVRAEQQGLPRCAVTQRVLSDDG